MARYQPTGLAGVVFTTATLASAMAPTAAEINAGTDLQSYILRDGLDTPASGNTVDASDLSSLFNAQAAGTYGGDALELVCHRGSIRAGTDDVAWTTLARGTSGYLFVARTGWAQNSTTGLGTPAGTATAADRCEVYQVTVITRAMLKTADNETSRFSAMLAIVSAPNDAYAVP